MILIVAKMVPRPEYTDAFPDLLRPFTVATRDEQGNLFFELSRSVDEPGTYVLIEGFRDAAAGQAHVASAHFTLAIDHLASWLAEVPQIVHVESDVTGWQEMGEIQLTG